MEINIKKELEELKNYNGEDKIILASEIKEKIEKIRKENPTYKIPFDFPRLNRITNGGCQGGQLITVGGNTSQGKTSLLTTFTYNFASQGIKSLWFSFEETEEELFERFTWDNLPFPEFYMPNQLERHNLSWIRDRILESIAKYGTKVVFIDHIQALLPFSCQDDRREIDNIVRFLKHLARTLKIVIIVASHVHRDLTMGVPTENDLRGSAMIAGESDIIMFIWRRAEKQTKLEREREGLKWVGNESVLYVAKCRRTGIRDSVPLVYDNKLFKEMDSYHNEEENTKGGVESLLF